MERIQLTIALAVLGAFLISAAACGGHAYKALAKGAIPLEHKAYTLQDALSELDALEKPEGVDAKLWDELKGALREALLVEGRGFIPRRNSPESGRRGVKRPPFSPDSGIQNPEPGWPARRTLKLVSSPPTGAANKVNDLTATRETNGDFTLSWHYRNLGDYDQNGVVGVSDITPLAQHFGETYDAQTESDSIQAVIDGSGSGKIGIEDVTQIAMNFGVSVAKYSVRGGDAYAGPFAESANVGVSPQVSDARKVLTINLGASPKGYWQVVPQDAENAPGEASNVAGIALQIRSVTPTEVKEGTVVTFSADVLGAGPFTYDWDFGGQAVPATSAEASPKVVLTRDTGNFPARLTVTNHVGNVSFPFTLSKLAREWKWEAISEGQIYNYQNLCLSDDKVWIYLGTPGWLTSASALLYSGIPGNWQVEDVPYKNGQRMRVSASGIPSILGWYGPDFFSAEMYLTEMTRSEWVQDIIVSGPVGKTANFIIGADDIPLVTFVRSVNEPTEHSELRYAMRNNGIWEDNLIEEGSGTGPTFGQRLDMAKSEDGTIGLCYKASSESSLGQLKYAQWNNDSQTWEVEVVDQSPTDSWSIGQGLKLSFNGLNRPTISYNSTNRPNGNIAPYEHYLVYSVREEYGWNKEIVRSSLQDTEPDKSPFYGGLLAHDPLGEPLIVVFSEVADERYMLWRDGTTWEKHDFPSDYSGYGPIDIAITPGGTLYILSTAKLPAKEVMLARYE